MIEKGIFYFLLGLAVGCTETGRSRSPPISGSGNIEDVVADTGNVDNNDDVTMSDGTPTVNSDADDSGSDDTPYDTGSPSQDAGHDSRNEYVVRGEEDGIQIITTWLTAQGYAPEVRSDSWSTIRLRNPQSGEYDLVLEPDVRFRRGRNPPAYSFFEFDSREDPGVGVTSDIPFYREVQPATEEGIKAYIQRVLNDL
ncbi:MAG: hypothetical protein AABX37_04990 [Nanoarchaeota archaeon]